MTVAIQAQTHGLKELERALLQLPQDLRKKVIYRALHDGARLVREEAKARAPVGTRMRFIGKGGRRRKDGKETERRQVAGGLIRANIVQQSLGVFAGRTMGLQRAPGTDTVIVRVRNRGYERQNGRMRFNRPGSSPGYWWLVEFGTSRQAARPFLRPAFETRKEQAARVIKTSIQRGLDVIALELGRRSRVDRGLFALYSAARR